MKKFLDILDRIEVAVASLVLAVLIGVTFVGVPTVSYTHLTLPTIPPV